jgi:hypothetical protein
MWDEVHLEQINQKQMAKNGEGMEEFSKIRKIFN